MKSAVAEGWEREVHKLEAQLLEVQHRLRSHAQQVHSHKRICSHLIENHCAAVVAIRRQQAVLIAECEQLELPMVLQT